MFGYVTKNLINLQKFHGTKMETLPRIFIIPDLLQIIVEYLKPKDIIALRCCKILTRKLKSEYYEFKTQFLQRLKFNPIAIAKIYRDGAYLLWLQQRDKVKIDKSLSLTVDEERKLVKTLRRCNDLKIVKELYFKLDQVKHEIIYYPYLDILLRFLHPETFAKLPYKITKSQLLPALARTPNRYIVSVYGRRWGDEISKIAIQRDDVELYAMCLDFIEVDFELCYYRNAYNILTLALKRRKPKIFKILSRNVNEHMNNIIRAAGYVLTRRQRYNFWHKPDVIVPEEYTPFGHGEWQPPYAPP